MPDELPINENSRDVNPIPKPGTPEWNALTPLQKRLARKKIAQENKKSYEKAKTLIAASALSTSKDKVKDSKKEKRKFLKILEHPILKIVPILGLIVTVSLWISKEKPFTSDEIKNEQDNTKQGDMKGPEVDTNGNASGDTAHSGESVYPIFTSDTFPVEKNSPKIKGILIDKFNSAWFSQNGSVNIRTGQLMRLAIAPALLAEPRNQLPLRGNKCNLSKPLMVGVLGNRLYLSVEFDDLATGENLGNMVYNHWRVWKDKKLRYRFDEESQRRFEVRDKDGFIALSVEYVPSTDSTIADVYISGYLFDDNQVLVMNSGQLSEKKFFPNGFDTCFSKFDDSTFKKSARKAIGEINSIFGEPNLKTSNPRFNPPN